MQREEVRVRLQHARALGYCARGVRAWCARHGIDYLRLVRDGVSVDEVLATGDELGARVARQALDDEVAS